MSVRLPEGPRVDISDAEYRMLCEMLRTHCGLHFDESSRFLVEKRVARRIVALEMGSFGAYHLMLRHGPRAEQELAELVDLLTTNETYFFREVNQLRALVDEVIPELLMQRRGRGSDAAVSIWSAGCSSGEEPYTVVAMALEAGLAPGRDLRVYASDISRNMLARSRGGLYRESAFRETPDHLRDKYFVEKDGRYRICDEVKKHVDFIHLNLLDEGKLSLLGTMDVILCRNVIIYFDVDTKKQVIKTFADKLRPGGYLLLGHSESLINISSAFELKHLKSDLVYTKPLAGAEKPDPWHAVARAALADVEEGESR